MKGVDIEEQTRRLVSSPSSVRSEDESNDNSSSSVVVYLYMLLFFGAMIGHEIALEAAYSSFGQQVDGLASAATCFQFSFCVFLPLLLSKGNGIQEFPTTRQELLPYIRLSVLVFGATGLSTQAVRYVTYPTKVVFKSAKLIPTMAVATVWQGQRFHRLEYVAAVLLCMGAAGYSFGSGTNNTASTTTPTHYWGILLLLSSILCDAIVPNYQKLLLNQGVPAAQLMINVNIVGTMAVLLYMMVTGQVGDVVHICGTHPRLLLYLTGVGIGLSSAVWAYTKLIQHTSSVVAVTVSTLRKVGTMCLSYVLFPKPLLRIHVVSGVLVLAGMVLSSFAKEQQAKKKLSNVAVKD